MLCIITDPATEVLRQQQLHAQFRAELTALENKIDREDFEEHGQACVNPGVFLGRHWRKGKFIVQKGVTLWFGWGLKKVKGKVFQEWSFGSWLPLGHLFLSCPFIFWAWNFWTPVPGRFGLWHFLKYPRSGVTLGVLGLFLIFGGTIGSVFPQGGAKKFFPAPLRGDNLCAGKFFVRAPQVCSF